MKYRRATEAQRRAALKMIEKGLPYDEIKEKTGFSRTTLSRWGLSAGYRRNNTTPAISAYFERETELIRAVFDETVLYWPMCVNSYSDTNNWADLQGIGKNIEDIMQDFPIRREYAPEYKEAAAKMFCYINLMRILAHSITIETPGANLTDYFIYLEKAARFALDSISK